MSKTPPPPPALRRQFEQALQAAARNEGWRHWEVVTIWIDAAFLALHGRRLAGEFFAENEAKYMKIVRKLRKPTETMAHFANALGYVSLALLQERRDFLGPTFMEFCANEHIGQFFTPPEVCELIAELISAPKTDETNLPFTINEPACGVGALLLAKANVMARKGFDPTKDIHFTAVDIDQSAAKACFIQLELANIPALIIHGNSLLLEVYASWPTTAALRQEPTKVQIQKQAAE